MEALKFASVFGVIFAGVVSLATWLVLGDSSPFNNYFLDHVALPNFLRKLLIIPYMVLIMVEPESESDEMLVAAIAEFLQWLVVGFLLALFINFVLRERETDQKKWLE